MSAPIPNPDPATANISLPAAPRKMGEFTISSDGKTASKEIVVDGKNLLFTVNFPASAKTEGARGLILKQFTEKHMADMGRYAMLLGLGTKDTVASVDFRSNNAGDLEAVKNRRDARQTKTYTVKEKIQQYQQKIESLEKDPSKKDQLDRSKAKHNALVTIVPFWRDIRKPADQKKVDELEEAKAEKERRAAEVKKPKDKEPAEPAEPAPVKKPADAPSKPKST